MRFHLCLIHGDADLKDVTAFVYEDSMKHEIQIKREVLLGDVSILYKSIASETMDGDGSGSTVTARTRGEWEENSDMDVWLDYLIGTLVEEL